LTGVGFGGAVSAFDDGVFAFLCFPLRCGFFGGGGVAFALLFLLLLDGLCRLLFFSVLFDASAD
jgi:glycerol-3-phosphate acyltransferase PlsY